MSADFEMFDDSFDDEPKAKGEFNFLITPITPDNISRIWRDLSNNQQDCAISKNDIMMYMVFQTPPHYGDVTEYLENAKVKALPYSKIMDNAYLNGAIKKKGVDGLVTTIENTATLMAQLQSARTLTSSVTINQGGNCIDCHSKKKIASLEETIDEQRHIITSLTSSIGRTVDSIASELGVKDIALALFEGMPTEVQKQFISTCILEVESEEDIAELIEKSKILQNIEHTRSCNAMAEIFNMMKNTIDSLDAFMAIATHEGSESGSMLSKHEACIGSKKIAKLRTGILSLTKMMKEIQE